MIHFILSQFAWYRAIREGIWIRFPGCWWHPLPAKYVLSPCFDNMLFFRVFECVTTLEDHHMVIYYTVDEKKSSKEFLLAVKKLKRIHDLLTDDESVDCHA